MLYKIICSCSFAQKLVFGSTYQYKKTFSKMNSPWTHDFNWAHSLLGRHLKITFWFFSWYLSFQHIIKLIIPSWRVGGSSFLNCTVKWTLNYGNFIYTCIKVQKSAAGTVVWAQEIYLVHICVEMEVLLLVLTFDSTGNV